MKTLFWIVACLLLTSTARTQDLRTYQINTGYVNYPQYISYYKGVFYLYAGDGYIFRLNFSNVNPLDSPIPVTDLSQPQQQQVRGYSINALGEHVLLSGDSIFTLNSSGAVIRRWRHIGVDINSGLSNLAPVYNLVATDNADRVYLAMGENQGSTGALQICNPTTGDTLRTIDTYGKAFSVAINQDDQSIWVISRYGDNRNALAHYAPYPGCGLIRHFELAQDSIIQGLPGTTTPNYNERYSWWGEVAANSSRVVFSQGFVLADLNRVLHLFNDGAQLRYPISNTAARGDSRLLRPWGLCMHGDTMLFLDKDRSNINARYLNFVTGTGFYGVVPPAPPTNIQLTRLSASSLKIEWTASTTSGVQYNVYVRYNNGAYNYSAPKTTSSPSYQDNYAYDGSVYCYVVRAVLNGIESDNSIEVCSQNVVAINVTQPKSGDNIVVGTSATILWTAAGGIRNVKIQLLVNGGSPVEIQFKIGAQVGTIQWNVPNTPSDKCTIRVINIDNETAFGESGVFSIVQAKPSGVRLEIPFDVNSFRPATGFSTPLVGFLTDESGKPIPNATIGIEDGITLKSSTVLTGVNGRFDYGLAVPLNALGVYTISALYDDLKTNVIISPKIAPGNIIPQLKIDQLLADMKAQGRANTGIQSVELYTKDFYSFDWNPKQITMLPNSFVGSLSPTDCMMYYNSVKENASLFSVLTSGRWTISNIECYNIGLREDIRLSEIQAAKNNKEAARQILVFGVPAAICALGAVPTGGASCLPLAIAITSEANHNVINGLVDKGAFDPGLRDALFGFEYATNMFTALLSLGNSPYTWTQNNMQGVEDAISGLHSMIVGTYDLVTTEPRRHIIVNDKNGELQYARIPINTSDKKDIDISLKNPKMRTIKIRGGKSDVAISHKDGSQEIQSIDTIQNFDLHIYNSDGKHVGRSSTKIDSLDEQIPNIIHSGLGFIPQSALMIYGDDQYKLEIVGDSTSPSMCDLLIENYIGDSIVSSQKLKIPVSGGASGKVLFRVDTGIISPIIAEVISIKPTERDFVITPNPTSGKVAVHLSSNVINLSVVNVLGEIILEVKNTNSDDFMVDLSSQISGTYYFKFRLPNTVVTKMVVRSTE